MNLINELPLSLGIHATHLGYYFLTSALELLVEDERRLLHITKEVYPVVAGKYHTTVACVDKNMRTLIDHIWSGDRKILLQNICLYPLTVRPTVSEFLDILYWELKDRLEEAA